MNKFIVSGALAKDPELNSFAKGGMFCKFTLANNIKVKVGDEYKDKATFFNIVAFGKQAEMIKNHWHKGDNMLCECEITENNYEKDGVKHYGFTFKLLNIDFFGKQKKKDDDIVSDKVKAMKREQEEAYHKELEVNSYSNNDYDSEIPF